MKNGVTLDPEPSWLVRELTVARMISPPFVTTVTRLLTCGGWTSFSELRNELIAVGVQDRSVFGIGRTTLGQDDLYGVGVAVRFDDARNLTHGNHEHYPRHTDKRRMN